MLPPNNIGRTRTRDISSQEININASLGHVMGHPNGTNISWRGIDAC